MTSSGPVGEWSVHILGYPNAIIQWMIVFGYRKESEELVLWTNCVSKSYSKFTLIANKSTPNALGNRFTFGLIAKFSFTGLKPEATK